MQLTKSRAFVAVSDSAFPANIKPREQKYYNSSTFTSSEFAHLLLVIARKYFHVINRKFSCFASY